MAPAFSKEAILSGAVDHLCLVCECHLRSDREVTIHITDSGHKDNMDRSNFVEKYRSDRIRKFKKWYLCELCNTVMSTLAKVGLHVKEPKHIENKSALMIERVGDFIVVDGNIAINEETWHGLIENTCTLCNVEFEDKNVHKIVPAHVINLIQCKISNAGGNIYREIDDSTFHCLTCNKVVAAITMDLDETKHKSLLQKCRELKLSKQEGNTETDKAAINDVKKIINKTGPLTHLDSASKELDFKIVVGDIHPQTEGKIHKESGEEQNNSNNKNASNLLDLVPKFQKNYININFETRTAICNKCGVNLEFNTEIIENHIEDHKNKVQKKNVSKTTSSTFEMVRNNKTMDSGILFTSPGFRDRPEDQNDKIAVIKTPINPTDQSENIIDVIEKAAQKHELIYTPSDNNIHCPKCNKHIPPSVKNIYKLVNGELHKNVTSSVNTNNSKHSEITKKTVSTGQFIEVISYSTNIAPVNSKDIVVNFKYCLTLFSINFLNQIGPNRVRCLFCLLDIHFRDLIDHLDVEMHDRAVNESPVLINLESEFIREVRRGTYHCGFCNIVESSWEAMEDHLKSAAHQLRKTAAGNRLREYLPKILFGSTTFL